MPLGAQQFSIFFSKMERNTCVSRDLGNHPIQHHPDLLMETNAFHNGQQS